MVDRDLTPTSFIVLGLLENEPGTPRADRSAEAEPQGLVAETGPVFSGSFPTAKKYALSVRAKVPNPPRKRKKPF
jgi:hypothetical protein